MGFQQNFQDRVIPAANRAFGTSAVLTHGAVVTPSFEVQQEDKEYDQLDAEGFLVKYQSRDFMFDIADSVAEGGTPYVPARGAEIAIVENGVTKVFEVLPIGTLPEVEIEEGGFRYRVHTKWVRDE